MIIIGLYNRNGYRVQSADGKRQFYYAGNSPYDSTAIHPLDDPDALPLRTLRKYCIDSTREVAKEQSATYGGIERMEDDDE